MCVAKVNREYPGPEMIKTVCFHTARAGLVTLWFVKSTSCMIAKKKKQIIKL